MLRKHQVYFEPADKLIEADEQDNLFFLAQRNNVHIDTSCGGQGSCHLCRISVDDNSDKLPASSIENLVQSSGKALETFQRDNDGKAYYLACRGHIIGDLHIRSEPRNQLSSHALKPSLIGRKLSTQASAQSGHALALLASQRSLHGYLISLEDSTLVATESIVAESAERRDHFDLDDAKALISQFSEQTSHLNRVVIFGDLRESLIEKSDLDLADSAELVVMPSDPETLKHLLALGSGIAESETTQLLLSLRESGWALIGNKDASKLLPLNLNHIFDGVGLQHGMPAAKGAIDSLQIVPMQARILLTTIGEETPEGISTLGYFDAFDQITRVGLVGKTGRFVESRTSLTHNDGSKEIVLVGPTFPAMSPEGVIYKSDENISVSEKDYQLIHNALDLIRDSIKQAVSNFGTPPTRLLIDHPGQGQLNPHTIANLGLVENIDQTQIEALGDVLGLGLGIQTVKESVEDSLP